MSGESPLDIAIVGGGIVGLSTAFTLAQRYSGLGITIFEKEADIAQHQTGHNSGVIHSGIYYRPGSQRGAHGRAGVRAHGGVLRRARHSYDRCGKVIVATQESQIPALEELARRAEANGVPGVRMIGPEELKELEPYATGIRALHVPSAGIVNYSLVAGTYGNSWKRPAVGTHRRGSYRHCRGGRTRCGWETPQGAVRSKNVITCGGLFADRVSISAA